MSKKLSHKQELFVEEYLKDLNATQAAIRAGYSKKTAGITGFENLKKPNISRAIAEAQEKRIKRVQIDADYVLNELYEIREMDISDILDDHGNVLPIKDWPKIWRKSISGLDIQELMGDGELLALIKKIKWPDKLATLKLLGQHIDIQAFKEKIEHEGEIKNTAPVINLHLAND